MDIGQINSQLSAAKAAVRKGDITGSLKRFVYSLHALVQSNTNIPTDVRGLIRELSADYNSFESLRNELKINFDYVPGEEKKLLAYSMKAYEHLTKSNDKPETYEETLARKKAIDTNLVSAKDFLSRGFVEQADEAIARAIENYKDEKQLFAYIGKLYLDHNYVTRAKSYYKKATEVDPENQEWAEKYLEVSKMS